MAFLGRWCFRHRWSVLIVWLVAFLGLTVLSQAAKAEYSTNFRFPNTPSAAALALLQKQFPAVSGDSDQIVLYTPSGHVSDPDVKAAAERMLRQVATLPHVRSVLSPFSPAGAEQVSKSGTVAFATVNFDKQAQNLSKASVDKVISVAQAAGSRRLQVELGGNAIQQSEAQTSSISTLVGVVFTLIVLGVVFGAFFAALLPLITALIAIGIGYAITSLLTHVLGVASFAPILGILIGLGVGVDYALFILTRHRAALKAGRSVEDAAVNAVNTSGRAVFFAGLTVCIALLGQFALGLSFLYGVAVTAAITVALTMLSALTLLPALLGFFGMKVMSRRQRTAMAASGPVNEAVTGWWRNLAEGIQRRPIGPAVVALGAVIVVALPILTLRLGLTDAGSDPQSTTSRHAYDLLAKGFGPGFNGPLLLVGELHSGSDLPAFKSIVATVAHQPGVASVTPPFTNPRGTVGIVSLYPSTSPQAAQTSSLLKRLRNDVIPKAQAGTGVTVLIGGSTALGDDFAHVLSSKLPQFVAVVVVLAFLLLMAVFRSLLIPLIASVMNLLSIGAALGIMNAVFEWGWGSSLLGLAGRDPVEVFIPVILFSILFGLSMDYEVFLVSRMHEEWLRRGDNSEAVTMGQAETGRVITAAATIMILVFASFTLQGNIVVDEFGIGLAGAIFIDAFVVRTVLVPSLMHLAGKANWWLPGWLDRSLPKIHVDAADLDVPARPPEVAASR